MNQRRRYEEEYEETTQEIVWKWAKRCVALLMILILFFVGLNVVWNLISPQLNLYRANTEKKAVIQEQKAISEAAEFAATSRVIQATAEADAERERAKGLRDSQEIISQTLTENYLRYLYIQTLDGAGNQIIYIPTEGGLPVLEAGRLNAPTAPVEGEP